MARFLADENIPASSIAACRAAGMDFASIAERAPGASDDEVISIATAEQRVLLTFDKDFGMLVFGRGSAGSVGVVLLRLPLTDAAILAHRIVLALHSRDDWAGNFSVVESDRVRMTPLPSVDA